MLEFVFLWLEMNGLCRVSRGIQTITVSYMIFVTGGLGFAIALNGFGLFLKFVVVPSIHTA